MWQKEGLLDAGETCLPVFFGRDKWEGVRRAVGIVQITLKLAVSGCGVGGVTRYQCCV